MARRTGFDPRKALRTLASAYQKSAEKRGYLWCLTVEEFVALTQGPCHYCGVAAYQKYRSAQYNGLDRVDNKKGYLLDNVVPACGFCNLAKRGNSIQQFYDWIERVSAHHGKRNVPTEPLVQSSTPGDSPGVQGDPEASKS